MDEIQVLNGTVRAGDRVAVAVGAGRYGGGMRVGEVLEIPDDRHVKLRIDKASGGMWGPVPFTKTYEYPKRMVKL